MHWHGLSNLRVGSPMGLEVRLAYPADYWQFTRPKILVALCGINVFGHHALRCLSVGSSMGLLVGIAWLAEVSHK
jgi:hypothetical protein